MKTLDIFLHRKLSADFYRVIGWDGPSCVPTICINFVYQILGELPPRIKLELSPLPQKGFKQIYFSRGEFNPQIFWGFKKDKVGLALMYGAEMYLNDYFDLKTGMTRMYVGMNVRRNLTLLKQ